MKQKKTILILIYLFLSILLIEQSTLALTYELIYFRTNKELYYADESIEIEASWEMDYVEGDDPYFQIRIFDDSDKSIWNSSTYKDKGFFELNWTIKIENLNLNISNYSNIIAIKAIMYNRINGGILLSEVLDTLDITIIKRNIHCQLANFRDTIILGKNLAFSARFYHEDTNTSLSGQEIMLYIFSNNLKIYESNYTSNYQGIISLNLSSTDDMLIGINYIIFNITNGVIYNQSIFNFEILVEKIPVYIDIIKYERELGWNENVELELFFYYLNDSIVPLINQTIKVLIYDNFSISYNIFSQTDKFGILKLNISSPFYEITQLHYNFYIDLIYNGSFLLKNKNLVLDFEISTVTLNNNNSFVSLVLVIICSIFSMIIIINYLYMSRKKKPKFKRINEICFRF